MILFLFRDLTEGTYSHIFKRSYISTHIHTYSHIFIHIHTYSNVFTHIHTYSYLFIHILTYSNIHTYSYIFIHIHTYSNIFKHSYIFIHIHTYSHIFIHIYTYSYIFCVAITVSGVPLCAETLLTQKPTAMFSSYDTTNYRALPVLRVAYNFWGATLCGDSAHPGTNSHV